MERMDEILNRMVYSTQDRQYIKIGIEELDLSFSAEVYNDVFVMSARLRFSSRSWKSAVRITSAPSSALSETPPAGAQ